MKIEKINIQTKDNFQLAATVFKPENPNQQLILINAAMGVKQVYYEKFAQFLAKSGFWVYTYDYRGIGASKPQNLKSLQTKVSDWIEKDYVALLEYIFEKQPELRLIVLGHSLGGQILAYTPYSDKISAAIHIASQTGYWNHWAFGGKLKMLFVSYLLLPVLSHLFGYFPGRKTGMGEDLPKGVALEWAKWCRSRNYLFDYLGDKIKYYQSFNAPLLSYSFEDDSYAPKKAVAALLQFYSNAQIEDRHIYPHKSGIKSIGHFGFFRKQFEPVFWKEIVEWLEKIEKKQPISLS